MVNRVLAPSDRTAKVTLFVLVAALLWIGPPAAAQDCAHRVGGAGGDASTTVTRGLEVVPSDGQYPGETIQIAGSGFEAFQAVLFEFGGNLDSFDFGSAVTDLSGSFVSTETVPDVPAGSYTLTVAQFLSNATTYCSTEYTVLFNWVPLVTVPTFAMIDDAVIATTSQPTTPQPTVAEPPAAPADTATTESPTTPTTDTTAAAVEPSTSAASDITVLAAPQPTDSGSNEVLLGLLIGLGVSVVAVSAWALGRRGRTGYQPPAPPPI